MRNKNPYDSGWRAWLIYGAFAILIIGIIWLFKIGPKLELCKTYYKELSTWSCWLSDYGLPQAVNRK